MTETQSELATTEPAKPLNIFQRLNACMKEAQYVTKEKLNPQLGYRAVSHDAVTALLRPVFITHGVAVIPSVTEHECDVLEGVNREGKPRNTLFTKATVEVAFVNIDKPDDRFSVMSFGYGLDFQDKGPGKAISYAVKYAMLKVLCLETGDDPERDNIDYDSRGVTITKEQCEEIERMIDDTGSDLELFLKWLKVKSVDQIPAGKFDTVIVELKKKGSKA